MWGGVLGRLGIGSAFDMLAEAAPAEVVDLRRAGLARGPAIGGFCRFGEGVGWVAVDVSLALAAPAGLKSVVRWAGAPIEPLARGEHRESLRAPARALVGDLIARVAAHEVTHLARRDDLSVSARGDDDLTGFAADLSRVWSATGLDARPVGARAKEALGWLTGSELLTVAPDGEIIGARTW